MVIQRTLSYTDNFIAPELYIGQKEKKTMYPQCLTNSGVLQASLNYFMSLTNYLGQETTVITGDQLVYEVLMNIKKKYPERYGSIVVRLGGFPVAVNFMGAVSHLMKGIGIDELLVENSAYSKGKEEEVLNGKHYYKMLLNEAVTGVLRKEFEQWPACENILTNIHGHVLALSDSLKEKDVQSTSQSRQDVMNCLKSLILLWL